MFTFPLFWQASHDVNPWLYQDHRAAFLPDKQYEPANLYKWKFEQSTLNPEKNISIHMYIWNQRLCSWKRESEKYAFNKMIRDIDKN